MVTVLLAIDNDHPDRVVFNFAVQFCRRMKAKLDIVHIERPQLTAKKKAAEFPQGESNFQIQFSEPFISFKPSLEADDPEKAIASYIREHHNVVLAIYDTRRFKSSLFKKTKTLQSHNAYPLLVPLVMARRGSQ